MEIIKAKEAIEQRETLYQRLLFSLKEISRDVEEHRFEEPRYIQGESSTLLKGIALGHIIFTHSWKTKEYSVAIDDAKLDLQELIWLLNETEKCIGQS